MFVIFWGKKCFQKICYFFYSKQQKRYCRGSIGGASWERQILFPLHRKSSIKTIFYFANEGASVNIIDLVGIESYEYRIEIFYPCPKITHIHRHRLKNANPYTDELYGLHHFYHFRDGLKSNTPTTSRNKKHRLLESIQFNHNLSAIFCWLENFCLFDLCSIKINEPIIKLFDRSHWRRQSNKSH